MTSSSNYIIGVDPGTGLSSPLGWSIINIDTKEIIYYNQIGSKCKSAEHRIKEIADQFEAELAAIYPIEGANFYCYIESFVMRGKGGMTLQRLIGAILSRVPYDIPIEHVQNTTIKLIMAEYGHADKKSVAEGSAYYLRDTPNSKYLIYEMIESDDSWDILDSLAIAITGWRMSHEIKRTNA